ncbi:TolC family protein [Psychromonas sp. 14N.309.X.WAT.B.A12]|uniref:TolC family protein n=1 Tax=Psychromonas sp. 14N.309.X.WAT.B.A12 TaxID=2998322 RepID=UPI0025B15051|nr:TolC family protein [Psychromonas sp. 14N.309.X.WAT.B.A12]MDN2662264.1 TolC family protein [Psychromonas sp. 14N.309.X.WAT.B.A12]
MKLTHYLLILAVGSMGLLSSSLTLANTADFDLKHRDKLNTLIKFALNNDQSRKQFFAQSEAMREMGIANSTLKDPKLKLGVGNLPVDSFAFDQESMTNISIGLMQEFERGSTLSLQKKKLNQQADSVVFKIKARELDVINNMTKLWLELGFQQKAHQILVENKKLMKEMARYIKTSYSLGQSEVHDLLNAEIQISKLDERLQENEQMQQRVSSQLSEWLGIQWLSNQTDLNATPSLTWDKLDKYLNQVKGEQFYGFLNKHPISEMAQLQIEANTTQVSIAEEAYTPKFAVEVVYGHRQADGMDGQPAADLVSAYLTMDIPLFTDKRQDKSYSSAKYQVVEAKSNKAVILSRMNAQVNALLVDKHNLEQRILRYNNSLLPQMKAKTSAVERGYQQNTAQFDEIINTSAEALAMEIEKWRLVTDLNKANSNLAYLLDGFEYSVSKPLIDSPFNETHY